MSDQISRQAAIEAVHSTIFDFFDMDKDDSDSPMTESDKRLLELNKAVTTAIRKLPNIDVPARKVGKWIDHGVDLWCSECGCRIDECQISDSCPKCGAKMDGKESYADWELRRE